MIHLIDCEHDDEGGSILLLDLTDAQRCCLMQIQERVRELAVRLTEIGAGWPVDCVCYHVGLKGRYVYADATDGLAQVLPDLDAEELHNQLADSGIVVPGPDKPCRPEHATGDALMRILRVGPDGGLQLAGTVDDEYVPGVGWVCGPAIRTVSFDLANAASPAGDASTRGGPP